MNGVVVRAQRPIDFAAEADAVIVGSGRRTRELIADAALMARIRLDPARQLIGAQCSGALMLATLGLLGDRPACTDATTRPWVEAAGVRVLPQAFHADGTIATAGGCLAAHYLATWLLVRMRGRAAAEAALSYVVPVGEERDWIDRAIATVDPAPGDRRAA
jgi:transcriptional regulator GlxA family with amidase domain